MKLTTARQAVSVASEILEAFGGAGYVEDTGLPALLRDSQVLSIWEGTTNVLSLDALRTLVRDGMGLELVMAEVSRCVLDVGEMELQHCALKAKEAIEHAEAWLTTASLKGPPVLEAGARRFAMTVGRSLALALLTHHAQWSLDNENDTRARDSAVRFAQNGVDLIF
jgi:hypothetical protein